ncbi:hypothetical protein [Curtobacterium sp. MCSS17_016]|uniref:hypothetical protein n=1 Tax=Curtobacterium sp. MCSS17_016 TaxID=2175644 RepID=UPI000DA9EB8F|nr:hypothetical protein [Curtobacterium sp. MCSS17_016]WIE80851.1 hypothetical protein DEJ19_020255 [Curtobacterium sp. MCSS17_016]
MSLTRIRASLSRALRREHGATDPILVIAAIAVSLVLLVGGSFAVAGMIANGKDLNAKGDLDKVATAEAAWAGNPKVTTVQNSYVPYLSGSTATALAYNLAATGGFVSGTALEKADVGFTPTDGGRLAVVTDSGYSAWAAVSKSSTGAIFIRTSTSSKVGQLTGAAGNYTLPSGVTLPTGISLTGLNGALTTATGF